MEVKRIIISAVALVLCMTGALRTGAQTNVAPLDSAMKVLQEKVQQQNEPDSTKYYNMVAEFQQKARDLGRMQDVSLAYSCLIGYLTLNGNKKKALSVMEEFKDFLEENGLDQVDLYDAWQNLILGYYNESRMIDAITELKKMQDYVTDKDDYYGLSTVYQTYGTFYLFSYEEAVKNFEKARGYMENHQDKAAQYYVYYLMATAALAHGMDDDVLKYSQLMLDCAPKHSYVQQLYYYLRLNVYVNRDEPVQAKVCYDVLDKYWQNYEVYAGIQDEVLVAMIKYLCKFGNPDKAADLFRYITLPIRKLEVETIYYQSKGQLKTAIEKMDERIALESERMSEMQQAEMMDANAAYDNQRLEIEKAQLEIENAKNQNQRNLVIIFGLLLVLAALTYIVIATRRHNTRLRIERDNTEEQRQIAQTQREIAEEQRAIADQQRLIAEDERSKAVHLNEMKTAFIHNMSHEIRTPLNAIMGFNDLLNSPEYDFPMETRQEMVGHINSQSENLMNLLHNVMFLSRIDGNDLQPKSEDLHIKDNIDSVCAEYTKKLGSDVSICIDTAVDGITVRTDREIIEFTLKAVIENAVKFTKKGQITIKVQQDETPADFGSKTRTRIMVSDTGPGIPAESHELAFERFEKLSSMEPGFGLGLSISREALALIGARIYIDKDYTGGGRIIIDLI